MDQLKHADRKQATRFPETRRGFASWSLGAGGRGPDQFRTRNGLNKPGRNGSRRQRSPFSQECGGCRSAAAPLVGSHGTDGNVKRARRGGRCTASCMPDFGSTRLNGARDRLPMSRTIIRTRRIARARCDFRARSGLVVKGSGRRRIAPERYLDWHRQTNGHKARERIWAGA
jgi:hypothetical protein